MIFKGVVHELASHGHSSVLHNHAELLLICLQLWKHLFSDFLNFSKVRHVHLHDLNLRRVVTVLLDAFELGDIASWEDEVCSVAIKFVGEILSESGGGSGDPDEFVGVVWFGNFPAYVGE